MRKLLKNAIKICYRKRQCVSASGGRSHPGLLPGLRPWTPLGDFRSQDPLACAVRKFPLKTLAMQCQTGDHCEVAARLSTVYAFSRARTKWTEPVGEHEISGD